MHNEHFNSIPLTEFIKLKGGDKIINGIYERDVFIMNDTNQSVAKCFVSPKVKNWSLDSLLRKGVKSGDIIYYVYLDPNENKEYCIYPLKIAFTAKDLI